MSLGCITKEKDETATSQSLAAGASSTTPLSCGLIHFGGSAAFLTRATAAHSVYRGKGWLSCNRGPHNASTD